ncbi:MAG: DUF1273 domain-containing protein [Ruminococcus sp.]|nr:DUF1273 domain-containing protein [Ruminococcus sp.]
MDNVDIISAEEFYTDKASTCCFTGHRRRDLPFEGDISKQGVKNLISTVHLLCHEAYGRGIRTFITGMAEGSDIICGSVIMDLMHSEDHPGIELICALPYEDQIREIKLPKDRYIYSLLLRMASAVVVTGNADDSGRYRRRNKFMVDNSSELIAIYKEKQRGSGTLQTINMAKRNGLDMHVIELDKNPQFYYE